MARGQESGSTAKADQRSVSQQGQVKRWSDRQRGARVAQLGSQSVGNGIVTARDFTNDPKHGIVSDEIAKKLIASRDDRIKYVISNSNLPRACFSDRSR